jgi:hypothetical protein
VDIDGLVSRSGGATQAFLKDWDNFDTAPRETRAAGGGTSGRIIGFLSAS